jgi:hypothetical protein
MENEKLYIVCFTWVDVVLCASLICRRYFHLIDLKTLGVLSDS